MEKLLYFSNQETRCPSPAPFTQLNRTTHPPILHYYNPTRQQPFYSWPDHARHLRRQTQPCEPRCRGQRLGNKAAKCDDLADEGRVLAWVKNAFLDFASPTPTRKATSATTSGLHCPRSHRERRTRQSVLEIAAKRDKVEEMGVENRWLPPSTPSAKSTAGTAGTFLKSPNIRDAHNDILKSSAHENPKSIRHKATNAPISPAARAVEIASDRLKNHPRPRLSPQPVVQRGQDPELYWMDVQGARTSRPSAPLPPRHIAPKRLIKVSIASWPKNPQRRTNSSPSTNSWQRPRPRTR